VPRVHKQLALISRRIQQPDIAADQELLQLSASTFLSPQAASELIEHRAVVDQDDFGRKVGLSTRCDLSSMAARLLREVTVGAMSVENMPP